MTPFLNGFADELAKAAPQFLKLAQRAKRQTSHDGHTIKLEYDAGDTREGVNKKTGKKWSKQMKAGYGYIPKTTGVDGECVDVYLAKHAIKGAPVFIVRQVTDEGAHDEDKCMMGFDSAAAAKECYLAHTPAKYFGGLRELTPAAFKAYLEHHCIKKPRRAA